MREVIEWVDLNKMYGTNRNPGWDSENISGMLSATPWIQKTSGLHLTKAKQDAADVHKQCQHPVELLKLSV